MILICERVRNYDDNNDGFYYGYMESEDTLSPVASVETTDEAKKFLIVMEALKGRLIYDYVIMDMDKKEYTVVLYKGKIRKMFDSHDAAVDYTKDKKRTYDIVPLKDLDIDVSAVEAGTGGLIRRGYL